MEVVGGLAMHPRFQVVLSSPPQALMSLFVLASKDGWVDIMYDGLDAVGVDQQVGLRWAGSIFALRSLTMGQLQVRWAQAWTERQQGRLAKRHPRGITSYSRGCNWWPAGKSGHALLACNIFKFF